MSRRVRLREMQGLRRSPAPADLSQRRNSGAQLGVFLDNLEKLPREWPAEEDVGPEKVQAQHKKTESKQGGERVTQRCK